MNILCLGDIVGKPGRDGLKEQLPLLKEECNIDVVIANGENAAGGVGLTPRTAKEIFDAGVDVITLGDHVWDQRELLPYLENAECVIRPANFPPHTPGNGWCIFENEKGIKIGVINILGRVFMRHHLDCPFRTLKQIAEEIKKQTDIIVLDFHAEATSEKIAMGHFANGMVSAVVGTHTHVQTADEKILSEGTAHITDLGMCGPHDSVIGQDKEIIVKRFLTSRPMKFSVAQDDVILCGVSIAIDEQTGKAVGIKRVQRSYKNELSPSEIN